MLKITALGLERENRQLFSNLTFKIKTGTLVYVSGPNGSGKSSLLRILAGLCLPSAGERYWEGEVYYLGHKLGLQLALSPRENLNIWLKLWGVEGDIGSALAALELQDLAEVPCENLSRGECQRVALAALWLDPPLCWILDEPFTGLDKKGIEVVCERLTEHLQKGGIVLMATHQLFSIVSPHSLEIALGTSI